jgi:hypothetical protein
VESRTLNTSLFPRRPSTRLVRGLQLLSVPAISRFSTTFCGPVSPFFLSCHPFCHVLLRPWLRLPDTESQPSHLSVGPPVAMFVISIALLLVARLVQADHDIALFGERNVSQFEDGHDLARYMSVSSWLAVPPTRFHHRRSTSRPRTRQFLTYAQRPDLRPPILSVTQYNPAAVSPGYFFVSPYGTITPPAVKWDFQPFESGPMIYDNAGVCCARRGTPSHADRSY